MKPRNKTDFIILILAVGMFVFHMAAASPLWLVPNLVLRSIHLLFAISIGVLLYPSKSRSPLKYFDIILIVLGLVSVGFAVIFSQDIVVRPPWTLKATPFEIFIAISTIVVVLEVTRRCLGMAITGLCIFFILYAFIGPYLRFVSFLRPLAHRGVSISEFVDQMYFSFEGIFGIALGVSSNYIFLFVMFGSILQIVGGGDFFIATTRYMTGKSRGAPAKMAVLASGFMGMMSGSSVANVATTGSLTIPMMKKLGYPARFAGAVEAVASTGGQITPPILGAAAFLMAAILGINYLEIAKATVLPAILYFTALFIAVHLLALKNKLASMEEDTEGSLIKTLWAGWTFLIPLGVILGFLLNGFTTTYSAFWGVVATILVPYLRRSTHMSPKRFLEGIRLGVSGAVIVTLACASAGIIVGVVQISGLGFRFSTIVSDLTNNSLGLALVLAMIAAFIFGMGMPTTPAYIVQATLVAPVLVKLGAMPLAAHLFVFYYAVLGQITPPLAVAAYAAAPIAGETPSRVGWTAFSIGIPIYIIPFLFIYNSEILNPGLDWNTLYTIARSFIAVGSLSIMVVGWFCGGMMNKVNRMTFFTVAVLMIYPNFIAQIAGAVFAIVGWYLQRRKNG